MLGRVGDLLSRVAAALWGKFESKEEIQKFAFLAGIFCLMIGVYWTLRPMKDSIFFAVVGAKYLWMAKILSLCVISPLVVIYGKLIDTYPRHRVFYALMAIYGTIAIGFAFYFMSPSLGLLNKAPDPSRFIGWAWYVFVEIFGSILIALFWAFTADTTLPDSAKRGFPMIALFGQLGNMVGPAFLNTRFLGTATSAPIVALCGGIVLFIGVLFWVFMRVTPKSQLTGYQGERAHSKKKDKGDEGEPGFFEGLRLLLSESYLLGIFLIIALYELVVTVIDNHFKMSAAAAFPSEAAASAYLSSYATYVGVVAFLCVLFGINNITRRLGMLASLVLLPILVDICISLVFLYPLSAVVPFWIMVCAKAINYALNQPTLKQLYIPTSPDAKYKSQAWIEAFGSRGAKASASFYNGLRTVISLNTFLTMTLFASFGVIGLWFMVIMSVSKQYNKAIADNAVVC